MSEDRVQKLHEIRDAIRKTTAELKRIVEHPEIMDDWDDKQLAWMKEHLEMLREEYTRIQNDIQKMLDEKQG